MIKDMGFYKIGDNKYSCNIDELIYGELKSDYKIIRKPHYMSLSSKIDDKILIFDVIIDILYGETVAKVTVDKDTRIIQAIDIIEPEFFNDQIEAVIETFIGFIIVASRDWF